jgi:hypothetical protein
VDITVYLPDEIARRAKDKDFNLSRMLRNAVELRLREERAMATTLESATEIRLDLEDGTIGRFTGKKIAEGHDVEVYLSEAGKVVVYESDKQRHHVVMVPEDDLASWLPHDPEEYAAAMRAVGLTPVIDLDV